MHADLVNKYFYFAQVRERYTANVKKNKKTLFACIIHKITIKHTNKMKKHQGTKPLTVLCSNLTD